MLNFVSIRTIKDHHHHAGRASAGCAVRRRAPARPKDLRFALAESEGQIEAEVVSEPETSKHHYFVCYSTKRNLMGVAATPCKMGT
jgi:hypothetical protein